MRTIIASVVVLSLLVSARSCSAYVQEVTNIRHSASTLSISTAVGCSSLVRSSQSLSGNANVECVFEKHLQAYRLTPTREGTYNVGPVTLNVGGW